jgi:Restriction endonuclease
MERNTGKDLEELVARLERLLCPDGFEVVVNRRILDDDGVQLAEFDVEIKSVAGRRSVNWLIECRDRPSAGPAPSAWIEQLVGRRELHQLDQVIAVSTTGFSIPATKLAESAGIVLRRVTSVIDLASDFKVAAFRLVISLCHAATFQINADGQCNGDLRNLFLRRLDHTEPQRFVDFVYDAVHWAPEESERETGLVYIIQNEPMEFRIGEQSMLVRSFHAQVVMTRLVLAGTALAAKLYSQDDQVIGQEGLFTWTMPEGPFRARVQVVSLDNGKEACSVEFLDALPNTWQGRELHVYGKS